MGTKKRKRRKFSAEFKAETVRFARECGVLALVAVEAGRVHELGVKAT
jgi:transposase-like protein